MDDKPKNDPKNDKPKKFAPEPTKRASKVAAVAIPARELTYSVEAIQFSAEHPRVCIVFREAGKGRPRGIQGVFVSSRGVINQRGEVLVDLPEGVDPSNLSRSAAELVADALATADKLRP